MKRAAVLLALTALAGVSNAPMRNGTAAAAGGSTLTREEDPVVLTGADVPSLAGIAPGDLVAFRYDTAWVQIPVQVDERDVKTFGTIYNNPPASTITALQYTDAGTFTGPDSNTTLDANDEIAFMAQDAGGVPPVFSTPGAVIPGSGVRISVSEPLAVGQTGYVYLFRHDGSLDPGAGQAYVMYTFNLLSGGYKTTYTLGDTHPLLLGNPENSTVVTPNYSYHFGDRWQEDEMRVSVGGATNVDILDRHKALFAPGICGRSEDTFDGYINTLPIEGAFVVNKSGPVRAIRSYVGANSGPLTEREHIFYARRQDIRTYLRVHAIPSVMDFIDYSPAASGMTYYNNLNTGGVSIDGVPDSVTAGPIQWQMATGAQGTVVQTAAFATNIAGFAYTSYYLDTSAPPALTGSEAQCTGDGSAYGSSGVWVTPPPPGIPCTDPGMGLYELPERHQHAVLRGAGGERRDSAGAERCGEVAADLCGRGVRAAKRRRCGRASAANGGRRRDEQRRAELALDRFGDDGTGDHRARGGRASVATGVVATNLTPASGHPSPPGGEGIGCGFVLRFEAAA